MKIAIFGTSADPPTLSHQKILAYLSLHYDRVAVYASDNPFKTHGSSLKHRSQMLELLIKDLYDREQSTSNILFTPEISDQYTINTVTKVKCKLGEDNLITMVVGGDLVEQIFTWYKAQELWQDLKVLVVPRDGHTINNETIQKIDRYSLGCRVAQCKIPAFSSTDYRKNNHRQILSDCVNNYIQKNNLYHFSVT